MSKHTPGPWRAAERGDYSDLRGNSRVILGNDRRIAIMLHNGRAEDDANAYLTAAAPKLLEHITLAADVVEELKNMSPGLAEAAINMLVPVLRNTIAKAEGSDNAT